MFEEIFVIGLRWIACVVDRSFLDNKSFHISLVPAKQVFDKFASKIKHAWIHCMLGSICNTDDPTPENQ